MGSESTASPNLTEENPQQNPSGDGQAALEATRIEISPKSVFVNSEPLREDQVQNAVKFLSHSKVRGSPIIYRRSFLQKKGLTREEIDEAFCRVPDPAPSVTTTQEANANPDGQSNIATNSQPQVATTTAQQPAVAAPSGVFPTLKTLPAQFHWSHALLAIGFLAASGAGTAILFKNAVVPRLKSWIRKVVLEDENDSIGTVNSKPNLAEETAAAAKAAAAAAADVAKASQEMLNAKNEERKYMDSIMNLLDVQVEEMKSMSSAIQKLEGAKENTIAPFKSPTEVKYASRSARPSSVAASVEPLAAPHPKSYMEIMSVIQRGEKPPGIKEINDSPPNPNQPPSNPHLAPRIKPWEVNQVQNGFYNGEGQSTKIQDIMPTAQLNNGGDTPEPWWQQKNTRITEIESEDEQKMATYHATSNERPNQRTWVPPVAPPIAMPEAAAAIRQPKSSLQKEKVYENQFSAHPSDEVDELERITKISESGVGDVDIQVSEESHVNETQEEQ